MCPVAQEKKNLRSETQNRPLFRVTKELKATMHRKARPLSLANMLESEFCTVIIEQAQAKHDWRLVNGCHRTPGKACIVFRLFSTAKLKCKNEGIDKAVAPEPLLQPFDGL